MRDALFAASGGYFIRLPGGFWYAGEDRTHSYATTTIMALAVRGYVRLIKEQGRTFPTRAEVIAACPT